MNQIAIIPPTPITLLDDLDDAKTFARAEKALNTQIGYESDFRAFAKYAASHGVPSLPADPAVVASWLAYSAKAGLSASTIGRRVSAVRHIHKLAGRNPPTDDERVRATVRGIRRTVGTTPKRKAPATADIMLRMLAACDTSLQGLRDAALLSIGFATAMRRSELCALTCDDIAYVQEGLQITVRRSKTDQTGEGATISVPHGYSIRPCERLRAYMDAAGITEGPVFRSVRRGGYICSGPLTALSVAGVVKRLGEKVGIDPATLGGHSLRSGFLTSAAENGASVFKMTEVSRHKSIDVLAGYVRSANTFVDHAGKAFL